jgi:hypothetical protein
MDRVLFAIIDDKCNYRGFAVFIDDRGFTERRVKAKHTGGTDRTVCGPD